MVAFGTKCRSTRLLNFIGRAVLSLLAFAGAGTAVATAHTLIDARVRTIDHCPTLFIAGQRVPPLALYVYINFQSQRSVAQSASEIRLASRRGINIITFPVGLPNPAHPFIHRSLGRLCSFILKNNPKAWLLPRVWCGVPGFDARHPSLLIKYADAQRPQCSIASRRWYHAVANDLKLFIAHAKVWKKRPPECGGRPWITNKNGVVMVVPQQGN